MNIFLTILLISLSIYSIDAGECQVHNRPTYLTVTSNENSDNSGEHTVSNFANNLQTLLGLSADKEEKHGKPIFYSSRPLEIPSSTWLIHVEGLDRLANKGVPLEDNTEFNIDSIYSKLRDNGNSDALNSGTILITSEDDIKNLKQTLENQISQMDKEAIIKYIVIVCDQCEDDQSLQELERHIKTAIDQIVANDPQTLAMTLTTKQSARVRRARALNEADDEFDATVSNVTIATFYSVQYPVMFNLFFWTSLVLVLVLISIVYVFLTLDPGSDTIIYRMTTPRLKVD